MDNVAKTKYIDTIDVKTVNELKKHGFFVRNGNFITKNPKSDIWVAIERENNDCNVPSIAIELDKLLKANKIKNINFIFSNDKLKEFEIYNRKVLGLIISNVEKDEVFSGIVASGCYKFIIRNSYNDVDSTELLNFLSLYEDKSIVFSSSNNCVCGKVYFYDNAICENKMLKLTEYLNNFDKIHNTLLMISSVTYCEPITNDEYFVEVFSSLLSEQSCFDYETQIGNLTACNKGIVIRVSSDENLIQRIANYIRVFTEECNG